MSSRTQPEAAGRHAVFVRITGSGLMSSRVQADAAGRRQMQTITMTSVVIEPITQFPNGEPIPAECLLMQGRALAKWEPSGEAVGAATARAAVARVPGTPGVPRVPGTPAADGDSPSAAHGGSRSKVVVPAVPGTPAADGDLLGASASIAGSRLSGNASGASGASGAAERDLVELVRAGKHKDGRFDDRLVDAAADLIQRDWKPSPPPRWVTYVRSSRHPTLTPDYAERLASKLGLPCLDVIAVTREVESQKAMPDPFRRCENVAGVFEVSPSARLEPVLLFDDIVSSGWTLTSAGMSLRKAGVSVVHPFVLADFSEMAGVCRFASAPGFTSGTGAIGQ